MSYYLPFLRIIVCGIIVFIASCQEKEGQWATTPSGLKYQFHSKIVHSRKPAVGEVVTLHVLFKNNKDSVLQNTFKAAPVQVTLQEPSYSASLEEAIAMMAVGDSATFYIQADSVFAKSFHQPLPEETIEPGSYMAFTLKLLQVHTPGEIVTEREKKAKEIQAARQKEKDIQLITDYIANHTIQEVQQTANGLFYTITKPGQGRQPQPGDSLQVHYIGRLIDGTKFDSSYDQGQPLTIPFGTRFIIPGWEQGIAFLRKGGKATLFIPSGLSYGPDGLGDKIPADANLILEVELVDIR